MLNAKQNEITSNVGKERRQAEKRRIRNKKNTSENYKL